MAAAYRTQVIKEAHQSPDIFALTTPLTSSYLLKNATFSKIKLTGEKDWPALLIKSDIYTAIVTRASNEKAAELFKAYFKANAVPMMDDQRSALGQKGNVFKQTLAFQFIDYPDYVGVTVTSPDDTIVVGIGICRDVGMPKSKTTGPVSATTVRKEKLNLGLGYATMVSSTRLGESFDDDIEAIPLHLLQRESNGKKLTNDKAIIVINSYLGDVFKVLYHHIVENKLGLSEEQFAGMCLMSPSAMKQAHEGTMTTSGYLSICSGMFIDPAVPIQIATTLYNTRARVMQETSKQQGE